MFITENQTPESNKPTRRFDYDAYIKGRLQGIYVIAYIEDQIPENQHSAVCTVEDNPATDTLFITSIIAAKPRCEKFINFTLPAVVNLVNKNSGSTTTFSLLAIAYRATICIQISTQNCRGTPSLYPSHRFF